MKRKFALVLALIMVCATILTACGSKNVDVADTKWKLTSGEAADGTKVTGEMIESVYGEFTIEFKADGSCSVSISGQTAEATWKQEDKTVTLNNNGTELVMVVDDGKLKVEEEGETIFFTKQ